MDKEEFYLKEDKDLLDKVESNMGEIRKRDVLPQKIFKADLTVLQIKSTLRNRKTMVDLDKSNKRFTLVIAFLAIIQVVIAGLQFGFDVSTSSNLGMKILFTIAFALIIVLLFKYIDPIIKKEK